MPYTISNPPAKIDALPKHAKEIWIAAFNAALKEYGDEGKANATAWAACAKAGYAKDANGKWHKEKRMNIGDLWDAIKRLFEPLVSQAEDKESSPAPARSLLVTRTADGKPRWLMIAASAVINRVGAIDSTALYDSFIRSAETSGKYPQLDFCHEGETICFGVADWLRRDGALYLASGIFYDTDIARAAVAGLETDTSGYWGASIAFRPTSEPQVLEGEGMIPVYTQGENDFISIVPQRMAANLFTATITTQEVQRMNQQTFDELVKLIGPEAAAPFAAQVDEANRAITDAGMVTRSDTPPAPTTPAEVPAPVAPEPEKQPEEKRQDLTTLEATVMALTERVNKIEAALSGQAQVEETAKRSLSDAQNVIEQRLQAVEKNSQAWQAWIAGLPEQRYDDTTYRARQDTPPGPTDSGTIATNTLSQMKRDLPRKR